ncbi:winged helix-turn-helix domain-containing protein [Rubrivirga sp. IMCC45206]|uniref:winged helix-turn-helix domain-containing protein n=1 Tax=Rubrivirga sp. IMCC45206 TaxID=3391614 RepID=UPI00398F9FB7
MPDSTSSRRAVRPAPSVPDLDAIVHQRVRLGILSALAAGGTTSFTDLKTVLELTDGNLSVHARKLEDAGYIEVRKSFAERVPLTEYALTDAGLRALGDYLDAMEAVIASARPSS